MLFKFAHLMLASMFWVSVSVLLLDTQAKAVGESTNRLSLHQEQKH